MDSSQEAAPWAFAGAESSATWGASWRTAWEYWAAASGPSRVAALRMETAAKVSTNTSKNASRFLKKPLRTKNAPFSHYIKCPGQTSRHTVFPYVAAAC